MGDKHIRPSTMAAYSNLFEKMLDPVLLLDAETSKILDANPAAESLCKANWEDLVGQDPIVYIASKSKELWLQALRISKRRYYPRSIQCTWEMPGEPERVMEINFCSLDIRDIRDVQDTQSNRRDEGGNRSMIQVIAKDITREMRAEETSQRYLFELREANEKLALTSRTDGMTGLLNFRTFRELLESEHLRAARYGLSFTLIFCDLDHFKFYNDHHGHQAGDEILREVAKIMKASCRNTDSVFRYGGEEFVILCPETDADGGKILAKRILDAVANAPLPHAQEQPLGKVTLSIGVAAFPKDGQLPDDVLKSADQYVYQAKELGRNRVVSR